MRLILTCVIAACGFAADKNLTLTEAACTAGRLGSGIATTDIGEPVSEVVLLAPVWVNAKASEPAYCTVDGTMAPVEKGPAARPIHFRVLLPASWSGRATQMGGGRNNGVIPNLTDATRYTTGPSLLRRGFATYGSDSGHQTGGTPEWALSDEAIQNLGYMQMKKTHDAAMVILRRAYGRKPQFNYYLGTSQGGREALTVAQRYARDYNGVIANVLIVNFSSLMVAPEWIRIQEKPLVNWVTPAKVNAIRAEFIRQCDTLDGLADGVISNYMACRARFASKDVWAAKRCPNDTDPAPGDTSANACLTGGQIATLHVIYSPYRFATPLANGVKTFGMWVPNTDPAGSGLLLPVRFRGQEGAAPGAAMHSHLGVLGVTGYLMRDLKANPLDYVEGGALNARRQQLSEWLDATNPDFTKFAARGGKLIVTIGTNDTLASPGAQLDYYQSMIDKAGQARVNRFARLFVIPQVGHGLAGTKYESKTPIPNTYDKLDLLVNWVERRVSPPVRVIVTGGEASLPLCNYPLYPHYKGGAVASSDSFACMADNETTRR